MVTICTIQLVQTLSYRQEVQDSSPCPQKRTALALTTCPFYGVPRHGGFIAQKASIRRAITWELSVIQPHSLRRHHKRLKTPTRTCRLRTHFGSPGAQTPSFTCKHTVGNQSLATRIAWYVQQATSFQPPVTPRWMCFSGFLRTDTVICWHISTA